MRLLRIQRKLLGKRIIMNLVYGLLIHLRMEELL